MIFFKKIFRRKREKRDEPQPRPLRIEGTKTPLTPEPDDAELAAQALLESPTPKPLHLGRGVDSHSAKGDHFSPTGGETERGATYYRELSRKIQKARQQERRAAMRYVAYVEEQLAHWGQTPCNPASPAHTGDSPRSGQGVGLIERELYKRQDVVEREGGELLKRWQHCLAEVIVRQMTLSNDNNDNNDNSDSSGNGGGGTPVGID
jgi:hypothetical protein